jgi:hypothetical protein
MRGRATSSVVYKAEAVVRNYQMQTGIAQEEGIAIPMWLFAGGIGFVLGGLLMPSLMAMTEEGSRKLAELSRQYIKR